MPEYRCVKCKGFFWWYDDSRDYCINCTKR